MKYRVLAPVFFAILWLPTWVMGQTGLANNKLDSLTQSHIAIFKTVGITDTAKAIVRVIVKEIGPSAEPVQGATVLLRRDKDKTLGRVTKQDGRCNFMPIPANYAIRVQLTGYKSLDTSGLLFERGKVYELELRVARN